MAPTAPAALDPFAPASEDERLEQYGRLRALAPVVRLEHRDLWLVSRHGAVREVLRRSDDFVSGLGTGYVRAEESGRRGLLVDNDPPDHTRLRGSIGRALEASPPSVRSHVGALVDEAIDRERVDAVVALARPLPIRVVGDLLGLHRDDDRAVAAASESAFRLHGPEPAAEDAERVDEAITWLRDAGIPRLPAHCLGRTLIERGDDDGDDERAEVLFALWVAGLAPTTGLIAAAVHALATNPEQWQVLRADPGLAAGAVEETLRHASPIRFVMRRTTRPQTVADAVIPADADVCVLVASANRDPAVFDDPDRFWIRRSPNDHVALGTGIHRCLGATLARLAATELVDALARRVARIALDGEPARSPNPVVRGWTRLPIRLA